MDKFFFFLICFLAVISSGRVCAQIAEGGTPAGFSLEETIGLRSAGAPFVVPLYFDVDRLRAEDGLDEENGLMPRTSVILPVDLNMDNAGEWSVLQDGMKIWRLVVHAPEAIAVMLYYDRFFIPEGGKLFIYNASRTHLLGAYTAKTNPDDKKFATEFVTGDEIILEYNELYPPTGNKPDIRLTGIGYGYNHLEVYQDDTKGVNDKIINIINKKSCQVNINCPEGGNWQERKKGVAKTVAPIGKYGYLCSGSLVNNTAQDLTPYYLSAHHCFEDKDITFDQIIFYFHYESPGCTDATPTNTKTIIGAQMLVDLPIKGSSDGALLKLNSRIPDDYDVFYNGWDRRNTATTGGVGIHHPKGETKKIATFTSTVKNSRWTGDDGPGAENAHWHVVFEKTQNGYSQMEGGSSGSPLFNQAGLIVGTLTGGTATNCTTGSINEYGKFWYHWDNANAIDQKTMKDYLDPLRSGVETLKGISNTAAGNTTLSSLSVNPGVLVPAFSATQTGYTVQVAGNITQITVSATPADDKATVTGTGVHPLHTGVNVIRVVVTAPGNVASQTYTITVFRAIVYAVDPYEPNNTLAQASTLPVTFKDNTATVETTGSNFHNETDVDYYKLILPAGYHYSLSARLHDLYFYDGDGGNGDGYGNGNGDGNGDEGGADGNGDGGVGDGGGDSDRYTVDAQFACSTNGSDWSDDYDDVLFGNVVILNGGIVYFRVAPYFKGDAGNYLLSMTVERKPAGTNSETGLNALSIQPGTLSPVFNTQTTNYSATVGNSVAGVMVAATPTGVNATVAGVGYHPIQVGVNTLSVVVTAQDGKTQKTYTMKVSRRPVAGSEANLQSLTIDRGALNPVFSPTQTNYSVNVESTVTQINVSATAADEYAIVAGTGLYPLKMGKNEIAIIVTAENGSTFKSYQITVYRGGGSNADLRSLTIDRGALTPAFNPNTTTYTVKVGLLDDRISVTGEPAEAGAGATITGNGNYMLLIGKNTIPLTVTSPDNTTKKTYTLTVNRDIFSGTDNNFQQPLVAFPNPAHEQIVVSGLTGSGILTLFNVGGHELLRRNITSVREVIPVQSIAPGLYFIRVTDNDKMRTIKILKQ